MKRGFEFSGTSGLVLEEPLIFERSVAGRTGFSIPGDDIPETPDADLLPGHLLRDDIEGFPEVSEVDVVRHFTRLSSWNYSLDHGFYPLGSCTMKYNPKMHERLAALPEFLAVHPNTPPELAQGALQLMYELKSYLAEITGLPAVTLQPAAGAQGELTGMLIIKAYHDFKGESQRNLVLIPDSAHGTNPASSVISGLKTRTIPSGEDGCIHPEQLAPFMNENLAGLMLTNPNTLGIFEKHVAAVSKMVHDAGGLVYMDGANMNALLGKARPGALGVDVMHLNLHKTFSSPHGGGGPGSGPVAVTAELERFLPSPDVTFDGKRYALENTHTDSIGKVHCFYGNFGVFIRAYAYIRTLGFNGLKEVAEAAVINANYIRAKLQKHYHLPYKQVCMHECVFNDKLQQEFGVSTLDIAKRLMDYGFHPPTVYFPLIVKGAIMIEPTETESKDSIDQFIDAMIAIASECKDNPDIVKSAPHSTHRSRLDETLAARKPVLRWTGEPDSQRKAER